MVFDKTDTTLSKFISQASPEDLSAIASQIFSRVNNLEPRQQEQFLQQIKRDPQAQRILEGVQTH